MSTLNLPLCGRLVDEHRVGPPHDLDRVGRRAPLAWGGERQAPDTPLPCCRNRRAGLPNGKKLLFGSPEEGGLKEVSLASKLPKAAADQFENALGTLGDLIGVLEKHIGALRSRPSKLEVEFGASLSGDCNLWIVSGQGKAEFLSFLRIAPN
jgi:Trypsin-co-occurring domain 1